MRMAEDIGQLEELLDPIKPQRGTVQKAKARVEQRGEIEVEQRPRLFEVDAVSGAPVLIQRVLAKGGVAQGAEQRCRRREKQDVAVEQDQAVGFEEKREIKDLGREFVGRAQ